MLLKLKSAHVIALCVALVLFLSSVCAELFKDVKPCQLCLISRYLYLGIAISAAASLKISRVRNLLPVLVFCTFAFGIYHLGVESHWWGGPQSCTAKLPTIDTAFDAPSEEATDTKAYCDRVNWRIFGISSTLWSCALSAFLLWFISLAYIVNFYMKRPKDELQS
ncbi:MAG: disulfide bond formation protein B [Holosporales bacterium]|jgi:disulfide bond formation protein DsbB|nr:disulfide bond formation protein B [Holosporales bacterium]